jgi:nucleoside phosphorylase
MSARRSETGGVAPAKIAILAAQVEEIAPLLARLGARYDGRDAAARYWSSDVDRYALAVCGVGRRRARAAARALLDRSGASRLVVAGVAGALTEDLEPGALLVAAAVVADEGAPLVTDPAGVRAAISAGARASAVVTVDRMVSTIAERRELSRLAHALEWSGPVVVDMESYDAVGAAMARGVPATVLRVVSDGALEELPSFLERCRRADGDVDRARVALRMLAHPRSIGPLLRLRARVRSGGESLAATLATTLPALAELSRSGG